MKQCTKCNRQLDETYFHKMSGSSGLRSRCKGCTYKQNRKNLKKWKELNPELHEERHQKYLETRRNNIKSEHFLNKIIKERSNQKLVDAIRYGKIKKRNSCEICLNGPTECHHDDYSKPFDFIELCNRCHNFLHRQYRFPALFSKA